MTIERDAEYWAEDAKIEFAVAVERMMDRGEFNRKDLAELLGTSQAYITKVLRGDSNLTIESMAKLAYAVGGRIHICIAEQANHVKWFEIIKNNDAAAKTKCQDTSWANPAQGVRHANYA